MIILSSPVAIQTGHTTRSQLACKTKQAQRSIRLICDVTHIILGDISLVLVHFFLIVAVFGQIVAVGIQRFVDKEYICAGSSSGRGGC